MDIVLTHPCPLPGGEFGCFAVPFRGNSSPRPLGLEQFPSWEGSGVDKIYEKNS